MDGGDIVSIDSFYTQTFTPYTMAPAATFPYDMSETAGTDFVGALDTVSSVEKWADAQLVAISTHWIACDTAISIVKAQVIGLGTRRFEVTGVPDPVSLKASHHQEIYLKEIT